MPDLDGAAELLRLARALPNRMQLLGIENNWSGTPAAPGRAELAVHRWGERPLDPSPILETYWMGWVAQQAAGQHLQAFTIVAEQRSKVAYALYPLARSSIEASARACWLFDPTITVDERACRGLAERATQIEYMSRFRSGTEKALHSTIDARLKELRRTCELRNLTLNAEQLSGSERWRVKIDGCHVPKLVDFLEELLPTELARFVHMTMLAYTHGEPRMLWSLVEIRNAGTAQQQVWVAIPDDGIKALLLPTLFVFAEACERLIWWNGWEDESWEDLTDSLFKFYPQ